MTTWEYRLIDSKDIEGAGRFKGPSADDVEAFPNALGADGWEIVSLDWRQLEQRTSFTGIAKRARTP